MFTVTRYCVQPFERRGGRVAAGEPQQFRSEGEALAFSRAAQRRLAGVAIYSVTGEPVQNLWQAPRLVYRMGDVPRAFSPRSPFA